VKDFTSNVLSELVVIWSKLLNILEVFKVYKNMQNGLAIMLYRKLDGNVQKNRKKKLNYLRALLKILILKLMNI